MAELLIRFNRAGFDLGADLGKVEVHAFGIDGWCGDRRSDTAVRADGAEDVGFVVPIIAHYRWKDPATAA